MAKGQKKSNREVRKPKQAIAKVEAPGRSVLGGSSAAAGAAKRSGR